MRILRLVPVALALSAAVLTLAACGSSNKSSTSSSNGGGGGQTASTFTGGANIAINQGQKKGGTLNLVSNESFEHLDPGQSYFQIDYLVVYATQRPLYSYDPTGKTQNDLAAGPPQISADGKTVTVKIKPNIKFGGATTRTVTSDDVAYAIERTFNPNVPNGYAPSYYLIRGSDKSKGGPISGISTPDKTTIVFKMTKPFGGTFAQALTLPGSAPVPREIVSKMDKKSPTAYDAKPTQQAFTGPYMIQSYNAGRSITLVRNPSWDKSTDYRPAYADKIVWKTGGDPSVLSRQTLNSQNLLLADTPPAAQVKRAFTSARTQLSVAPLGDYYATLNTTVPPFNNANLRRAVVAAANREGYLLVRGGKLVGQVATHFIGPTDAAFNAAGGAKGFGFDFLKNPQGDLTVAKKYMKLAGYPGGKYTGSAKVLIVGSNADPDPKEIQIVQAGLQKLGFKTQLKEVPQQTMYSKFCGVVKAHINVCPTAGWIPDFPDAYSYLYTPFAGKAIVPVNNVNWAALNDPKVNAAFDKAAAVTDPAARKQAWAAADKILTFAAPAIPEIWSSNALLTGKTVKGVLDTWNDDWNLSFSSPQ